MFRTNHITTVAIENHNCECSEPHKVKLKHFDFMPSILHQKENEGITLFFLHKKPGDDILSQAAASQVPSALKGLTAVFGMDTGGTLSLLSPDMVIYAHA